MKASSTLVQAKKQADWIDTINIPPVFIVGCAGSGTTLISLMLDAHPRISISSQGAYIDHLRSKLFSSKDGSDRKRLEALHQEILPHLEAQKPFSLPTFEQLLDWVSQSGADPRSIITFYGTWEAREGKKELAWWGDSASGLVHQVPYLNFLFPECKFIFMVRDPRDVFASSKVDSGGSFPKFREEWEKSLVDGLLARLHLGASRVKEVKHETLVNDPKGVLQEICDFLQVAYTDEMLSAYKCDAATGLRPQFDHPESLPDPLVSSSVGQYSEILTQEEIDTVQNRLFGPMRFLGYTAYEQYEQVSRNELSKVERQRSSTLQSARSELTNGSRPITRHERTPKNWMTVPPVFIVGHGRSGTTLLRMMLTAHPNIFISSEGAYVCPLRCKISTCGDLRDVKNLDRLRIDLLPWLEAVNYLSPPGLDDLAAWVDQFGCDERALITFYGTWEARVLGKNDLAWWGDNEPSHVFNIPYFKKLFPNSKFILMIRDPRDVYASFKSAWPGIHTAESLALLWERCLLDGLLAVSRLGDSTVKQVRYENLVTNPKARLEEICEFLDVEYTDAMLKFHEIKAAKKLSSVDHHRNLIKPVFTSAVGKYRQALTREEIAAIEQRLGTPMGYFGYTPYEEYETSSNQSFRNDAREAGRTGHASRAARARGRTAAR